MRLLAVLLLALASVSCATPEQKLAIVRAAPAWELCYWHITGKVSAQGRVFVSQEIQTRPVDCREHLAIVQAKLAADGVAQVESQRMLQLGLQMMAPRAPQYPAPAGGGAALGVGFLKRQYVSGMNRVCIYDRLGSEVAVTVGAAELCSLSLP